MSAAPELILASQSPRRAEYLRMLGIEFTVQVADIDESWLDGESPRDHVERLAREKAATVSRILSERDMPAGETAHVLAGDTVVVLDGDILGKPADEADAVEMLLSLSDRSHEVASGLALLSPDGRVHSGVSVTEVRFRSLDRPTAEAYAATGEPLDKAGGYGIQGQGASLVESIRGDYYTVVGLPVPLMLGLFHEAGWDYRFGDWARLSD